MDDGTSNILNNCAVSNIGTVIGGSIEVSLNDMDDSESGASDATVQDMGKVCSIVEPFSFELYKVDFEKDKADCVEVEIYSRDDTIIPSFIVKNIAGKVPNSSYISKETFKNTAVKPTRVQNRDKKNTNRTLKLSGNDKGNNQEFNCNLRRNFFLESSALKKHMKNHSSENNVQNDQSCERLERPDNFSMRENIHTERFNDFAERWKSTSSLESRITKHEGKSYACDICPAAFNSKYELKIHVIKHADDLPYKCSVCDDKFSVKSRLKRHMMIHTGERPFQCEVCGIIFREQLTLDIHMSVHLSRGPYTCDVCGEKFSRLNSLILHRRVHKTDDTYSYVAKRNNCDRKDSVSTGKLIDCTLVENSLNDDSDSKTGSLQAKETKLEDKVSSCKNVDEKVIPCISKVTASGRYQLEKHLSDIEGTNAPCSNLFQEILSSGTVLKSKDKGQGYFIVLPKTLTEKSCTLYIESSSLVVSCNEVHECNSISNKDDEEDLQNNGNMSVNDASIVSSKISPVKLNLENEAKEDFSKVKKVKKARNIAFSEYVNESNTHSNKLERPKKKLKKDDANTGKLHSCNQCGKNYKTPSNLNVHLRIHTGERPYYCDFCRKGFKQMAHLRSHVRLHTGESPYQCGLCERAFNQSSRLRYHILNKHTNVKKKRVKVSKQYHVRNFYCKICDCTFIDSCYKTEHMRTHLDEAKRRKFMNVIKLKEKPMVFKRNLNTQHSLQRSVEFDICEFCGFQFKNVRELDLHKMDLHGIKLSDIHKPKNNAESFTEIKDKTGLNYTKIGNLVSNETIAEKCVPRIKVLDNGKYECSVCLNIFNNRSNANVHLRLHNGARPYVCSHCRSSFRQISHLKDHVRIHTGEKPFSCSVCRAMFAQSSSVKAHIKSCHEDQGLVIKNIKEHNVNP